jgi:predicted XRE-type DNA-binding protein
MSAPTEVAHGLPARIERAAAAVRDAEGALKLRLKHRRELILEAIDREGMSQQEVAKLAGVAKSRISAILASSDDDE